MKFYKTSEKLPKECRPVIGKYKGPLDDSLGGVFGMMTIIWGEWVTDAVESELYGCAPHTKIPEDCIPYEWAYLFEENDDN